VKRKFEGLAQKIVLSFLRSAIEQYFPTILTLLYTRLNANPPEKYKQRFVCFYYLVASRDESGLGADFFIKNSDAVQENVYTQLYLSVILPTTQQLVRPLDRKLAVVGLTKTLTDSHAFAVRYSKAGWGKTCEALLKLLENPPMPTAADDIVVELDVDDLGFGVGFTPLNTCRKQHTDYWPAVTDVKSWVGAYLKAADARQNGAIAQYVNQRLPAAAKSVLVSYMQ
jgi:exportin-2 (importin alpha re-exporter)